MATAAVSATGARYILRVTAGPSYHPDTHVEVPVNTPDPIRIAHELMDIELNVRIKDYTGLPRNSPQSSPYFAAEPHATNDDRYSICFRFTPKQPPASKQPGDSRQRRHRSSSLSVSSSRSRSRSRSGEASGVGSTSSSPPAPAPATSSTSSTTLDEVANVPEPVGGIPATDLQFGNDFAHPIRDRLPPGFNTAMGIVKWWIDPGLEGDAYSDTPHLYGPALSSINVVYVGQGQFDKERGGLWFEEGGSDDDSSSSSSSTSSSSSSPSPSIYGGVGGGGGRGGRGAEWRKKISAPETGRERMKWALRQESKEAWVWEWGRTYGADFFNPYLDFSDFSLRLPGFSLPLMKYIDMGAEAKRSHHLRYVLRNRTTGDTYLVIVFTLHRYEDVSEDGTVNPASVPRDGAEGERDGAAGSWPNGNAGPGEGKEETGCSPPKQDPETTTVQTGAWEDSDSDDEGVD